MQWLTRTIRSLASVSGISFLLILAILIWMWQTITIYLKADVSLAFFLAQKPDGIPILAGVLFLYCLWILEVLFCKTLLKRLIVHVVLYFFVSVAMYFWWKYIVYQPLVGYLEHVYMEKMSLEQALKAGYMCAVLFLPSLMLCGSFAREPNRPKAQLYQLIGLIVMCAALAYPVSEYWWIIAYPIQPFSNDNIIPYAHGYHEALKLFAGANAFEFVCIAWGRTRPKR